MWLYAAYFFGDAPHCTGSKMRRYIQTAVGFVMIIVVLTPVIKLVVSDEQILFNVYEESIGLR